MATFSTELRQRLHTTIRGFALDEVGTRHNDTSRIAGFKNERQCFFRQNRNGLIAPLHCVQQTQR